MDISQDKLERIVLNSSLHDPKHRMTLIEAISNEQHFTEQKHKDIFWAIKELDFHNAFIDMSTVSKKVAERKNVSQDEAFLYLAQLTDLAPYIHPHCSQLTERFVKRRLSMASLEVKSLESVEELSPFELISRAHSYIDDIAENINGDTSETLDEQVRKAIEDAENAAKNKGLVGMATGISRLDQITGGWQDGNLVTIAGRPGSGKTSLALMAALHSIKRQIPVLFYSREMTATELLKRLVAIENQYLSMNDLFIRSLNDDQIAEYKTSLGHIRDNYPLTINEQTVHLDTLVYEVKAFAKRQKGLVVIDYLQLMKGVKGHKYHSDTDLYTDITRNLKQVAKITGTPIIMLSQLNREVEKRPDKIPQLSDLKLSGSIEEDSNMVVFTYRPEYYRMEQFPDGDDAEGKADIMVSKNRNGGTGSVRVGFKKEKAMFYELSPVVGQPVSKDFGDLDEGPF